MADKSNLLRSLIGVAAGVLLIFVALKLKDRIVAAKKQPAIRIEKESKKVLTQSVVNQTIPVQITEKGTLQALKSVELFSEVQGILENRGKLFKPGQYFSNGELVLSINDDEFLSSLKASRSELYNLLAQLMPDLKLDYPDVYNKWSDYFNAFRVDKALDSLPAFDNEREKFFINSKAIVSKYYSIKNLEERHKKYRIYAPFDAVLTEALVFPGTLVRPSQKLGTLINPYLFEMAISVDASYRKYLSIGKTVLLRDLDKTNNWKARIARIDATVNPLTQGITVYLELSGKDLKAGMFLEASIEAEPIDNCFELSRKLLVENKYTYQVRGDSLALVPLDVVFFKEQSAVVKNLPDSSIILANPVPGAFDGMRVEIVKESE